MGNFEDTFRDAVGEFSQAVSPQVKSSLEKLYQEVKDEPDNVVRIRELFIELFEFLNTQEGKTQTNYKAGWAQVVSATLNSGVICQKKGVACGGIPEVKCL